MSAKQRQIELTHDGSTGQLLLDGMDLSDMVGPVAHFVIEPNATPELTVSLRAALHASLSGSVVIDDESAAFLIALGWTPPERVKR